MGVRAEGLPVLGLPAGLSPTAVRCLDRQFGEALDLAVTCRVLSDCARASEDPLTAVALERLATDLSDQAAVLAPLVRPEPTRDTPPVAAPQPLTEETCLAQLDARLSGAALFAQTDAMSPGVEAVAAGLLWSLGALYHTRRELLLVCSVLDSA
jgi:hypothetical protein